MISFESGRIGEEADRQKWRDKGPFTNKPCPPLCPKCKKFIYPRGSKCPCQSKKVSDAA